MKLTAGQNRPDHRAPKLQTQGDRQQKAPGLRRSVPSQTDQSPPRPPKPFTLSLTSTRKRQTPGGLFYVFSLHPVLPTDTHTYLRRKREYMGRYNGGPTNVLPVIVSKHPGGAVSVPVCANGAACASC